MVLYHSRRRLDGVPLLARTPVSTRGPPLSPSACRSRLELRRGTAINDTASVSSTTTDPNAGQQFRNRDGCSRDIHPSRSCRHERRIAHVGFCGEQRHLHAEPNQQWTGCSNCSDLHSEHARRDIRARSQSLQLLQGWTCTKPAVGGTGRQQFPVADGSSLAGKCHSEFHACVAGEFKHRLRHHDRGNGYGLRYQYRSKS